MSYLGYAFNEDCLVVKHCRESVGSDPLILYNLPKGDPEICIIVGSRIEY